MAIKDGIRERKGFSVFKEIAQRRIPNKHKQRQTILENIVFQCNFERERNQANAKRSLPNVALKKIWNCPLIRNLRLNDQYAPVGKQGLCQGCLSRGHAIKNCKNNVCGIKGCIKKYHRLLHSENQMEDGNHAVNVSAATINQINEVTSFLQIVPVSIQAQHICFP